MDITKIKHNLSSGKKFGRICPKNLKKATKIMEKFFQKFESVHSER